MVLFEDFRKADGTIDWAAHSAAQVAAGEKCSHCSKTTFAGILNDSHSPQLCSECKHLDSDSDEVDSSTRVRCPKCRRQTDIQEGELFDLYEEGEHEVTCPECEHEFTVETTITYSFESPALPDGEKSEEEEGA